MTTLAPRQAAVAAPARRWSAAVAPLLLGLLAAGIAGIDVARPAVWRDEVASITMAQRDWSAFWPTVAHVDAVHALYYAALHLWFDLVPYSPLTLRLPSVLATAGTAALVVVLGRRTAGPRAGLVAGALAAVLPSLLWAGGEGRSSAWTALLAAGATLALLTALDAGPGRGRRVVAWCGYGALLALAVAVFADAALLAPAHLVTVLLLGRGRRAAAAAVGGALVAVAPLLVLASGQRGQVDWIERFGPPPLWPDGIVQQWFRADAVAIGWALAVAIGLLAVVLRRRVPTGLLAVALPWAVLPPVLLAATALVGDPLYWPRYVTFTAPAVALVAGALLAALPVPALVAGVALLAAIAVPQLRADREPRAKADSETALAAQLVATSRSPADGRAGVLFGQYGEVPGLTTRAEAIAYPAAFRGLADLTAAVPVRRSTALFGSDLTPAQAVPRAARLTTVWILLDLDSQPKTRVPVAGLHALGFTETGRFRTEGSLLLRWQR